MYNTLQARHVIGRHGTKREQSREKGKMMNNKVEEFSFEISEHIGVLKTNASGWTKEFNVVSWNGKPGKFDIREWSEDHKKMSKGITLTDREAKMLHEWIGKQTLCVDTE